MWSLMGTSDYITSSPPDLRGGTFANFGPGGTSANKWLNMQFPSIDCIKTKKKELRLPVLKATQCWQTYLLSQIILHMSFDISLHMSFGLLGPL